MRLRTTAVALAATALMLTGPAAFADLVSNDLDDTVDTVAESMSLQYDRADGIAGPARSTKLRIVIDGEQVAHNEEHPGCNLPGGQHLRVSPTVEHPGIADVDLAEDNTFSDCSDTVTLRVAPKSVGETVVTFSGVLVKANGAAGDPTDTKKDFDFAHASFKVVVTDADLSQDGGSGTVCDRNPAAPAWANAILKANDVKLKGHHRRDVIRSVAQRMEKAASFPDNDLVAPENLVAKSSPSYPDEVHEYMVEQLELVLPTGPADIDRPDRVCTTVTAD